ncbi:MAG: hypothetical protein MUF01_00995 [Bryobacterales bacterium]|jgi:ATP-dependent DNA helicase RecG|nr:hypothetical protein [Bryobacterales bacterium]
MLSETELRGLLQDLERANLERTVSTKDTAKFSKAICAFANDMAGEGEPGYLLVGAEDASGRPAGLQVTDELLRYFAGLVEGGDILPPPAMTVD